MNHQEQTEIKLSIEHIPIAGRLAAAAACAELANNPKAMLVLLNAIGATIHALFHGRNDLQQENREVNYFCHRSTEHINIIADVAVPIIKSNPELYLSDPVKASSLLRAIAGAMTMLRNGTWTDIVPETDGLSEAKRIRQDEIDMRMFGEGIMRRGEAEAEKYLRMPLPPQTLEGR